MHAGSLKKKLDNLFIGNRLIRFGGSLAAANFARRSYRHCATMRTQDLIDEEDVR